MIYRLEHPNPQFMRDSWTNLNGEWQFEIDHGNSGEARKLFEPEQTFSQKINVPFCPESKLSGIEYKDFMSSVWYKREFDIAEIQLQGRVLLHFGAVDYEAIVYINGNKFGSHRGGYVSFSFDITKYLKVGVNTVTVHAVDDTRNPLIPTGKQSERYESQLKERAVLEREKSYWKDIEKEQLELLKAAYDTIKKSGDKNRRIHLGWLCMGRKEYLL